MRKALLASCLLMTACRSSPPPAAPAPSAPARAYEDVLLEGIPHVLQRPDFCGEACTEMVLRKLGSPVDQDAVFNLAGVDPAEGRGAYTRELKVALEALGFQVGDVWHTVAAANAAAELEAEWAAVHADLRRGVPSIVCTHFDESPQTTEHFRLIVGYVAATDEVVYHDPALPGGAYLRMPRARLLGLWPLKYERERWTVIRFRLEPGQLAAPPRAAGFTPADYAQHVMALRERVPAGFTVVIEPPFVVIGNDAPDEVRELSRRTVRWAVTHLKRDYFAADPSKILDIWLFRDEESYNHHARELFGAMPDTPYGYYSESDGALVMNIATGGGTLVHEIVHPFMDANFPERPAWLNEGLASLYEQSAESDGHIVGLTNWRLAGLQRRIRAGTLPSFRELTATTERQFYDDSRGDNYAQARYLLYYLQEKGLLVEFYRRFKADHAADPTGYQTLVAVLGERDMAAFQQRWEQYVLDLTFP